MSIALLTIGVLYTILLLALHVGNLKLKTFENTSEMGRASSTVTTKFTVIIPFRNEEHRILPLLESINGLIFPKSSFEVLFVNDDSTDASVSLISENLNPTIDFQILKNKRVSKSPKKDAITLAIVNSKYEWILTTDADCELNENWLETYSNFIAIENPSLICGPVKYKSNGSFLHAFQQLDTLSLQWVGMGSFGLLNSLLANGANMAYSKDFFIDLDGFVGNNGIASGDDIFMLEKAKKENPEGVRFLKNRNAIVTTQPENTWTNLINQRVRWASKTKNVDNLFSKIIGLLVFLANAIIIAGIFWVLFYPFMLWHVLIYFMLKLVLDAMVLYRSAGFFKVRLGFISVVKSTVVYPLITVAVVINSLRGNYIWKGRNF